MTEGSGVAEAPGVESGVPGRPGMPLAGTPGAEAPKGPWFYATLILRCPTCGVDPGERCLGQRDPPQERRSFHLGRYELARTLAGLPIKRHTQHPPN